MANQKWQMRPDNRNNKSMTMASASPSNLKDLGLGGGLRRGTSRIGLYGRRFDWCVHSKEHQTCRNTGNMVLK